MPIKNQYLNTERIKNELKIINSTINIEVSLRPNGESWNDSLFAQTGENRECASWLKKRQHIEVR